MKEHRGEETVLCEGRRRRTGRGMTTGWTNKGIGKATRR
jgi:hypothetical protein